MENREQIQSMAIVDNEGRCIRIMHGEKIAAPEGTTGVSDLPKDGRMRWEFAMQTWTMPVDAAGNDARTERNRLLREHCDSMNPMRWIAMTATEQQSWTDYRQALLDVPQQPGFPSSVEWPTPL